MMITRRSLLILLIVALLAAACGDAGSDGPTTTAPDGATPTTSSPLPSVPLDYDPNASFVRADVDRSTSTDVTDDELTQLVASNQQFAFDLFHAAADNGNLILSPYSIATALTMTLAGARSTTAEEMRTMLHLDLMEARIHAARNELDLRIADPGVIAPEDAEDAPVPFAIRTANSIWGQPGYPFLDAFLELLATDYDAGMQLANFAGDPEAARIAINDWVEAKTEGRIVDLIPAGMIDPMTRLVLVNAIWFKANWAETFDPTLTADGPFTLLDGSEVVVPMMFGPDRSAGYAIGTDYTAVRLPYTGDASMVIIMPTDGQFASVVNGFDTDALARLDTALQLRQVNLTMPSFEIRSELGLVPLLAELGMLEAFVPPFAGSGADFTGITEFRELYVSDVVHQAFITLDEEGTEAAAATAVVMRATSAPIDEPPNVTIDHPFLFMIRHDATGEILFMGQVTNPAS